MVVLHQARPEDGPFLAEILAIAADWRAETTSPSAEETLGRPELARYIVGWPRPGDTGVVAVDRDERIGGAWYRFLPASEAGYGYVADHVPEITIGVRAGHRGRGVGEMMLLELIARARSAKVSALSLSVEQQNPALRLYERLGFATVKDDTGALTMVLRLDACL